MLSSTQLEIFQEVVCFGNSDSAYVLVTWSTTILVKALFLTFFRHLIDHPRLVSVLVLFVAPRVILTQVSSCRKRCYSSRA